MALLPEDNKPPGPVTTSTVHGLPFMPQASTEAVAIYNALVRLIDEKLIDKTNGVAVDLYLENLVSTGTITAADITADNITVNTLATLIAANITTLTATTAAITTADITTANVENLTVANQISELDILTATISALDVTDVTVDSATVNSLNATTATADNLTSTDATINNLTVESLTASTITLATTYIDNKIGSLVYDHSTTDYTVQTFTGATTSVENTAYVAKTLEGNAILTLRIADTTAPGSHIDEEAILAFKFKLGYSLNEDGTDNEFVYENYELTEVKNWPTMLGTAPTVSGIQFDKYSFDFNGTTVEPLKIAKVTGLSGTSGFTFSTDFITGVDELLDYDTGSNIYTRGITIEYQIEARG